MDGIKNMIYGMKGGDLVFLAGRPDMGKTRFALKIASDLAAEKNVACFYYSMQELTEEIEETLDMIGGEGTCKRPALYVEDDIWLDMEEVYAQIRKHKEENRIGLAVIDSFTLFIGHLLPEFGGQAVSKTLSELKKLALELDIPIMVLQCLDAECERRKDKRPELSDIGMMQDMGDVVIFLYRDECYNIDTPTPGILEITIAKNVNGDTASSKIGFSGGRFSDAV